MAEVVWLPGNQPPQNRGESRVVQALKEGLPRDYKLYPGLQMSQRGIVDDIDVLVLTPWTPVVVEIKDLAGEVLVDEHVMYVDGEQRSNPVRSVAQKAKRLKSRLEGTDRDLGGVWVTHLVVLARDPRFLQVVPLHQDRVVSITRALELLGDARALLDIERPARIPPEMLGRVEHNLGLVVHLKKPGQRFGAYTTGELIGEDEFESLWRGTHSITGELVELRQVGAVHFVDEDRRRRRLERAAGEIQAFRRMGLHPNIVPAREILPQDDGSVVLVYEASSGRTLDELLTEEAVPLDRRRVLLGLTAALAHAHRAGVVHGRLSPRWIEIRDEGPALLRGFSFSGTEGRAEGATVVADEDRFFVAPEALGPRPVGPAADLFGLGRIIQRLWPEVDGTREANLMRAVAEGLVHTEPARRRPSAAYLLAALEGREEAEEVPQPEIPPVERDENGVLRNGSRVGPYLVEGYIGSGATADLYKAYHPMRAGKVALKVFRRDDRELVTREFSVLEKLDHPHIVRAFDAGRVEDVGWYVAYEYLDGRALSQIIDSGPVDQQSALVWMLEVLDALVTIHECGAVHRDIKPENIIVVESRGAVLTDFGSASDGGEAPVSGTPGYRPPGVASDYSEPDIDLYAVGITLCELVLGHHPFPDRDTAAGEPDLATIPDGLRAIVERAIAARRADRFETASQFQDALQPLVKGGAGSLPEEPVHNRDLHRRIEALIEAGDLDRANDLCPPEWVRLREIIRRRLAQRRKREGSSDLVPTGSGVTIRRTGEERTTFDWTPGGAGPVAGRQSDYEVTAADGQIMLDLCLRRADNGETWIGVGNAYDSHPVLKRLEHGLTIGFRSVGGGRMTGDLTLAVPKGDDWAGWQKASIDDLSRAAGVDVQEELTAVGATGVGTRERVWGDTGRRKGFSAVAFPVQEERVPVLAYVLTRVVPLARAVGLLG